MSKTTRFCFTLNNYTDAQVAGVEQLAGDCKYLVYGKEVGESGTPHLQGFLILKKRARLSTLKNKFKSYNAGNPHLEKARGTNYEAKEYCLKDGDFKQFGDCPKGKGSRTDIKEFLAAAADGQDDDILASEYPDQFAKYHKAADKLRRVTGRKRKLKKIKDKFNGATLRPWQQNVYTALKTQDERKVAWVVDPVGNNGKSFLANYLVAQGDTYLVEGGKRADIAYAYNDQRYVVFDYTRQQEERINYGVIESFKNGRIFSSKYESGLKIFPYCKVLCLSNFEPDMSKLSEDRWDIWRLSGNNRPPAQNMELNEDGFFFEEDEPPRKRARLQ